MLFKGTELCGQQVVEVMPQVGHCPTVLKLCLRFFLRKKILKHLKIENEPNVVFWSVLTIHQLHPTQFIFTMMPSHFTVLRVSGESCVL